MSFSVISTNSYNLIALHGSYNVSNLPQLSPQLNNFFQEYTQKDLVIDMTNVTSIDSSIIRILLNLKKRIETTLNHLYLMHPSEDILEILTTSNLVKIINIVTDTNELQRIIDKRSYERYLPYTFEEKGLRRIRCTCGSCGSGGVIGYLLNPGDYNWKWNQGSIFPYAENSSNNQFDYFSLLPIICPECLMASTDISNFNILDEESKVKYKASIDDKTKILLSKSTKKRKKMMESGLILSEMHFLAPRNKAVSFQAYQLSEQCAKSLAIVKNSQDSFSIGFLNFMSLMYSPDENNEELINNCRTWLTQALAEPSQYSQIQLAEAYYILMTVSVKMEKFKDASKYFSDFTNIVATFPDSNINSTEISSPIFWYSQAKKLWQNEIDKKSTVLKV